MRPDAFSVLLSLDALLATNMTFECLLCGTFLFRFYVRVSDLDAIVSCGSALRNINIRTVYSLPVFDLGSHDGGESI